MSILNIILGAPTALAQGVNAGEIASETEGQLTQLVAYVIGQIPLWITAFIVVVLTFVVARIVKSAVENKMASEGIEEEHKEVAILASRTANAGVLIVGITVALKIAGIDLTAIIAAGAFGVGFALQDIIMNFIAGVMILSSRHYSIGDVIKVGGTMGKIVEIQTRATILKAFDGTKIVVPNADLFKNQVTSFTSNPFRRVELINGVNYGEDLKRSAEIVLNAVKETPGVLAEPKPSIVFYEWGDYSINFKVRAWVESRGGGGWLKKRHQMLLNINTAMDKAGINIPYPIQTIELTDAEKEEQKLMEEFERRNKETDEKKETQSQQPPLQPAPVAVDANVPTQEQASQNPPNWMQQAAEKGPQPEAPKPIAGIKPVEPAPVAPTQPAAEQPVPQQPAEPAPQNPPAPENPPQQQ